MRCVMWRARRLDTASIIRRCSCRSVVVSRGRFARRRPAALVVFERVVFGQQRFRFGLPVGEPPREEAALIGTFLVEEVAGLRLLQLRGPCRLARFHLRGELLAEELLGRDALDGYALVAAVKVSSQ